MTVPSSSVLGRHATTVAEHGRATKADDTWEFLHDPRMRTVEHGWKFHVSARTGELAVTVDRVLPVVLRYTCQMKCARSTEVLRRLNVGRDNPAGVGKAVTIYPLPDDVVAMGHELVAALMGSKAPRVVSDRRIDSRAPVYYRYGPFRATYRMDISGERETVMVGPDGETFPGLAQIGYRCPPWASDPFGGDEQVSSGGSDRTADHYRITGGIRRAAHGHVYRAIEIETDRPVVIKQGRAYVSEDTHGVDARRRLRTERRVLTELADVEGVPRAVDHFRDGEDEYLVTTSCGERSLHWDVRENGPYGCDPGRDWTVLAGRLVHVLDRVHARGVVLGDLTPSNVVFDDSGLCHLVDFNISTFRGEQIIGGTPGYSLPLQRTAQPAEPGLDYYALGATLFFATTGLAPVLVDSDESTNRDRTLACLAALHPEPDVAGASTTIAMLLSSDTEVRTAGVRRIRALGRGTVSDTGAAEVEAIDDGDSDEPGASSPTTLPRPPAVPADLLDTVIDHTLTRLVGEVSGMLDPPGGARRIQPLLGVYSGSSGIGFELLHHTDRADVHDSVAALARWTGAVELPGALPSGLYCGSAGVASFLTTAARSVGEAGTVHSPRMDELRATGRDYWLETEGRTDLLHGLAGVGLGHLLLAADGAGAEWEASHPAVAAECERRLRTGEDAGWGQPDNSGTVREHGFAHGGSGVALFLVEYARVTGDPDRAAEAAAAVDTLAAEVPDIVATMAQSSASQVYGSWCNGLPGIATTLLHAAVACGNGSWLASAKEAARACHAFAPRMALVNRCCGLAGLGEFLVDVAVATGDEEFWQAAEDVAGLVLARSGGPPGQPLFPDDTLASTSSAWGPGDAGVLSFLRRLRDRGGPRLAMPQ